MPYQSLLGYRMSCCSDRRDCLVPVHWASPAEIQSGTSGQFQVLIVNRLSGAVCKHRQHRQTQTHVRHKKSSWACFRTQKTRNSVVGLGQLFDKCAAETMCPPAYVLHAPEFFVRGTAEHYCNLATSSCVRGVKWTIMTARADVCYVKSVRL
jgi:hypothetical protein